MVPGSVAPDAGFPAASRYQIEPMMWEVTMHAEAPGPAQDRWCDIEGRPISLFCWVEQVAEHPEQGVLFCRLHQCGEVLGRGPDVLYVRFAGEGRLISVSPALVRLLPDAPGVG